MVNTKASKVIARTNMASGALAPWPMAPWRMGPTDGRRRTDDDGRTDGNNNELKNLFIY